MPRGGNGGGGGGKPGGGNGGGDDSGGVSYRGSRLDDTIYIVDDGHENGTDSFTVSQFLAGTFDGRRGSDTLDFSGLTSDGISINFSTFRAGVSFDQGYLGYVLDFRLPTSSYSPATFVGFENIIGTAGDDSITGFVDSATVWGGAGDDRLSVRGNGTIVIGGVGSDDLIANGMIYVGGDWDGTYGRQAGDGETDRFFGDSVVLDFELPDGTFAGDLLVVTGGIGSGNPDALDTFLALEFQDGTWTDPDGNSHAAAILSTIDGTGAYFTLVGISAADANALVLPNIVAQIGTGESGFVLQGTSNDDWFELYDDADTVLFELDGGNDTLLYGDYADPTDDTLYFEGDVPTDWTYSNADGVDVWTADYFGQTITLVGLDQSGFDSLSMVAVAPDTLG